MRYNQKTLIMKLTKYLIAIVLPTLLLFVTISCNQDRKKATEQLDLARKLYEQGNINQAKLEVDNIRLFYPKEYKIIKQGNRLMREIELSEQSRNIAFCDSLIQANENKLDSLTQGFILEKDPEYDTVGRWIYKTQTIERNIDRTYLRINVDEQGNIALASVYRGSSPIKHTTIKVSLPDGEYAETIEIAEDGANNYTFQDGGRYNEIVTFKNGKDNGVINFISTYTDSKIKVELIGKKHYTFILSKEDKEAILATYNLAVNLSETTRLKQEIELAKAKTKYLQKKINEADSIASNKQ